MKKYLIERLTSVALLVIAISLSAQTTNTENYIAEKTCYDADCIKKAETVSYFDGLGRAKQIVNVKASPLQRDVVTHFEYDAFGRQVKDYLPVPQTFSANGSIFTAPLDNASSPAVYGGDKFYSEKIPENSPLERIKQKIQLGDEWTTHPAIYNYGANTTADAVKKFTTTTVWDNNVSKTTLGQSGNYLDNQLYKNTAIDEDGFATIEFTNSNDQMVLRRKEISTAIYADTYYVYNEYDQLAFIIPPSASMLADIGTNTIKQDDFCYQYRYDNRYRLAEKKLPGKGWDFLLYDRQDRLVATQDANLRGQGRWLYTKYDKFGRVAITGIATGAIVRLTEQNIVDGFGSNNVEKTGSVIFSGQGMDVYYSNPDSSYPASAKWVALLSVNYYDAYPAYSFNPAFPPSILNEPTLKLEPTIENVSTKNLPVLSLIKNIEDNNWTKKYSYYDKKGRAIGEHVINHLGGYTIEENQLDFTGQTKKIKKFHKRLATDAEVIITEDFELDHQNRITKHWHQVNNQPQELLAENTYNERSLLSNKKVGNNIQSIDQQYDVRGWLIQINDPAILGKKLFAYALKYQPKYNGNISAVFWKTATDGILKRYSYSYDGLNRLVQATSYQPESTTQNVDYFESLQYDRNGNIKSLLRGGKTAASPVTTTDFDNLIYTYEGNRVVQIKDDTSNPTGYPGGDYLITYDGNGNMTSMQDKRIKKIDYNFLNLPNAITKTDGSDVQHVYRADGTKLYKKYTKGKIVEITTDYLDEFQYEHSSLQPTSPDLQFVSTAEGYYSFKNNKYIYHYKDQVGNIRVSFYTDADGHPAIDKATDFYPFGLEHQDGAVSTSITPSYRYGFQKQEKQEETGWSSFKWRNYDPTFGRFFNVDPLSEKYAYQSHYNFSENRVVDGRELEGLEVVLVKDIKKNEPIIKAANNGLYKDNPNTKTVHVFAHGGPSAFFNENISENEKKAGLGTVNTGNRLNTILNENSELWKNSESKDGFTVVLHSCRVGRYTIDKEGNVIDPVASKISESNEMKGVTIIGPDERDGFGGGKEVGPVVTTNANHNGDLKRDDKANFSKTFGSWNSFQNGQRTNQQPGNTKPEGKDQRSLWDRIFN